MFCKHEETLLLLSVSTALRHAVSVHGCQSVPVTDPHLSPSLRFTASSSLSSPPCYCSFIFFPSSLSSTLSGCFLPFYETDNLVLWMEFPFFLTVISLCCHGLFFLSTLNIYDDDYYYYYSVSFNNNNNTIKNVNISAFNTSCFKKCK